MRDRHDDACNCIKPGSAQFTPGDPAEDGDVSGHPGTWISGSGNQFVDKKTCFDQNGILRVDMPRAEERTIGCPTSTPTPRATPTPGPTPTPGSGGCPPLLKVGGMFLTAVSCGQQCVNQGYLGWRVNYTSTELCREGDVGCVCDPARDRCEMPRACQNPEGADIRITLDGHFENDLCDANSDNPFNCHHKPKANETGVTLFTSMPKGATDFYGAQTVTNCVDIQQGNVRQLDKNDPRCKAALAAAGR